MTKLSSLQFKTKEEAQAWIRKLMGPPKRRLEGKEHERMMLLLSITEPVRETNNQHSWCAEYNIGGKMYDVHYFPNEEPFIEEYLDETDAGSQ
jgi:hypothetical protein